MRTPTPAEPAILEFKFRPGEKSAWEDICLWFQKTTLPVSVVLSEKIARVLIRRWLTVTEHGDIFYSDLDAFEELDINLSDRLHAFVKKSQAKAEGTDGYR